MNDPVKELQNLISEIEEQKILFDSENWPRFQRNCVEWGDKVAPYLETEERNKFNRELDAIRAVIHEPYLPSDFSGAPKENAFNKMKGIAKQRLITLENEEHDAMMRSYRNVPLEHELKVMLDIDLAELQSQLPADSPGKILIENEWQRRKSSKEPNITPQPPTKNADDKPKHENRKWWAIFVVTFLGAVFAYPTFHQFIKQMFAANQENTEKNNKDISPEKSSVHRQLSSSHPPTRSQR